MSRVRKDSSTKRDRQRIEFGWTTIETVSKVTRFTSLFIASTPTILAISNFIECPSPSPPLLRAWREFVRRRETGVTRVRSFTPRGLRNTRGRNGENKFPRTRLCLRSDRDRHHRRHRFNDDDDDVATFSFRRQQKRAEKTIKTQLGRAR